MAALVLHGQRSAPRALFAWLVATTKTALVSYAQIFFSRSPLVGATLVLATMFAPRVGAFGLAGVLSSLAIARALNLSPTSRREGLYSYNALLVALALASGSEPSGQALALLLLLVLASVIFSAGLQALFGAVFNLPILSLPFLLSVVLYVGSAQTLGLSGASDNGLLLAQSLSAPLERCLEGLGAIFFLPRFEVGAMMLLALALHSRIATLLALVGLAAAAMFLQVGGVSEPSGLATVIGFNAVLSAIAIGGVWFVPSASSFSLAALSALIAALFALGLQGPFSRLGLPLAVIPFNLSVLLMLYATRQRVADQHPKSVDFLLGTPEENLAHYRTRLARFGARYRIAFAAPFSGRWSCTQGVDGPHTHRGEWRQALDFEVLDAAGATHRGAGGVASDYHCYRLPVLATADGTVVKVIDGVADNPIGVVNTHDNWGNFVLLYHAPQLYSLVAHLVPGSVRVREGQIVSRGDPLGLCGNSGRSPAPHLHFQLQATARLGSPTIPVELHDLVVSPRAELTPAGDPEVGALHSCYVPREGERVRKLAPAEALVRLLRLQSDQPLVFLVDDGSKERRERIFPAVDLYGNFVLRSELGATLYYEARAESFKVYDLLGDQRSVLRLLFAALASFPFDPAITRWSDHLPAHRFDSPLRRTLGGALAPFLPGLGPEVHYRRTEQGGNVVVRGSRARGSRQLETEAVLSGPTGITRLALVLGEKRVVATRIDPQPTTADPSGPYRAAKAQ